MESVVGEDSAKYKTSILRCNDVEEGQMIPPHSQKKKKKDKNEEPKK
jgi:hypothetical protein